MSDLWTPSEVQQVKALRGRVAELERLVKAISVPRLLDQDDMASDSIVAGATQQSIKAYADTEVAKACFMLTGTYTGNGSTSKVITLSDSLLVVKHVVIYRFSGIDANTVFLQSNDSLMTEDATGGAALYVSGTPSIIIRDDRIIDMGTGSFTVDDGGADQDPNRNGQKYHYTVFGTH